MRRDPTWLPEVHAGDKAVGADRGGEFEGVGALAAADIQHPHAGLQAKTVQDQRFPGDYSGQFVGLVKKMKEKAGLGALVDTREMRDFLAWGHARSGESYAAVSSRDNCNLASELVHNELRIELG